MDISASSKEIESPLFGLCRGIHVNSFRSNPLNMMQISTKEETGKKKGCGNQWKDGKATYACPNLLRELMF